MHSAAPAGANGFMAPRRDAAHAARPSPMARPVVVARNRRRPTSCDVACNVPPAIAEVDKWELAHFQEDEVRNKVKTANKRDEDALREKFFGF